MQFKTFHILVSAFSAIFFLSNSTPSNINSEFGAPVIGTTTFNDITTVASDTQASGSGSASASDVYSTGWDISATGGGTVSVRGQNNQGQSGDDNMLILSTSGGVSSLTIASNDGSAFKLNGIYLYTLTGTGSLASSITIQGKKSGSNVSGATLTQSSLSQSTWIQFDTSSDTDFNNVDEFVITMNSGTPSQLRFEDISISAAVGANTAPTASSFTANPSENLTYTFSTSDFSYNDGDGDPLDHILIEATPVSGTLYLDADNDDTYDGGEEVSVSDQISKADLDAGNLQYIQNGSTNSSFQFEVNDGTDNSSGNYIATLSMLAVPTVTLSLVVSSKSESTTTASGITATLSNSYGANTRVYLAFSGTATGSGVDYSVSSTSILVNAGNTTNTIILTNVPDALYEGNETVIVDISSVDNGTESGTQQRTFTILDDDSQPNATLEVLPIYNPITDESGGQAYVRGKIDALAGTTITIPLSFSGTASGGGTDYSITGTTITLSPGELMDSIRITSQYDGIEEGNETVIVDMGAPTNAVESGTQQVTITINDEDATYPSTTITTGASSPTNSSPFSVTITFSESVTGFVVGDIDVTNGSAGNFAGSGTTYTADITPSGEGTVSIDVDAGVAQDAFGLDNTAATQLSVTYDVTAPATPEIPVMNNTTDTGTSNTDDITSNTSPRFSGGSGSVESNSTVNIYSSIDNLIGTTTGSGTGSYLHLISGTLSEGTHDITITATDAAGNTSAESAALTIVIDTSAPTLSSSSPADEASGINTSADITLTFNENIAFGTGNIEVIDETDASNSFTIDAADPGAQASISGAVLTINPGSNLDASSNYSVRIAATAIDDIAGNSYAGITDGTTLNFTTNFPPTVTVNNVLTVNEGEGGLIDSGKINASDIEGSPVTFTITTAVANGVLFIDTNPSNTFNTGDTELVVGATFSKDDLDNDRVRYTNSSGSSDSFVFTVSDTNGGELTGQTFNITVNDITGPTITSLGLNNSNEFIEVYFNEGVYSTNGGSGALEANDLALSLSGGAASVISNVVLKQIDGTSDLAGGEDRMRVSFDLDATADGGETITVNLADGSSVFDAAGNAAAASQSNNTRTLNDLIKPHVTGVSLAADNSYIDITFNEGVYNDNCLSGGLEPLDFDLKISGGSATTPVISSVKQNDNASEASASALTGGETTVRIFFSVTGTPDGSETLEVDLQANEVFDQNGLVGEADQTSNNTASLNDQAAPTVTSIVRQSPAGAATTATSVTFRVTFSEDVLNVDATDFSITGGGSASITNVSTQTANSVFDVTVSNIDSDGTLDLGFDAGNENITDGAGNDFAGTIDSEQTYSIDQTAPTVTSIVRQSPGSETVNATSVTFRVTFSEDVINVGVADFAVSGGGSASITGVSVQTANSVFDVTISNIDSDGTVDLNFDSGNEDITDNVGNAFAGSIGSEQTYSIDQTAPSITSVTVPADDTYIAGESLDFTINFSESVNIDEGCADLPALNITIGSTARQAFYQSGGSTSSLVFRYTIQSGEIDANGIVVDSFTLGDGDVFDAAGNSSSITLNNVGVTSAVLVEGTIPSVNSFSPADDDTNIDITSDLVMTFDENVNIGTGNIIIYNSNDLAEKTIDVTDASQVSVSDNVVTINPTTYLPNNKSLYVQIPATAFVDASGNAYAGIADNTTWSFSTVDVCTSSTSAAAGSDQDVCSNTVTLAANTPAGFEETGTWSEVAGDGNGSFGDINSGTSSFTGTRGITYTLRWTISNGICTNSSDDVEIILREDVTANAGADQDVCGTSTNLAAVYSTGSTGSWSILSGAGGSVNNPSSNTSTFTGSAGVTYTLQWEENNGSCSDTDTVVITFFSNVTAANAGPDQDVCSSTTTLAANSASGFEETGTWQIIAGDGNGYFGTPGTITSNSNNAGFTGTEGVTYTLRWTISNGTCLDSTDDVDVFFRENDIDANAGADQDVCGTSTNLAAVYSTGSTGSWSILSGAGGSVNNPSSNTSTFTGSAGVTYTLQWEENNGSCSDTDTVVITFYSNVTSAAAGSDQDVCSNTTTLAANSASGFNETGTWTEIAGDGNGSFGDVNSATSSFTGTRGVTYTLRWTISNGACTNSSDDVEVVLRENDVDANAGADQDVCGTSTNLAAVYSTGSTGSWSILSGAGGSVNNPSSNTSTFTGSAGVTYTLQWEENNGSCSDTDTVVITFYSNVTAAAAGSDQSIGSASSLVNATLAANSASGFNETGSWSEVAGDGNGSFSDINSPTATFTGTLGITYTLRWTISNGACTNSSDDVEVEFFNNAAFTVTESAASTSVDEGGTTDSFTVVLDSQPSSDVVIKVTSENTSEVTADKTSLTFTSANWNTPQTVTVTGVDDSKVDADKSVDITLSIDDDNSDDNYDAEADQTVSVTNENTTTATVTIANVNADEDDGTVTITLSIDNAVEGGFTVDVSTSDGTATTTDGDYTALTAQTVTFAGIAGETQDVDITLGVDSKLEANENFTVAMSSLNPASAASADIDILDQSTITIVNDDTASVTIEDADGNEDDGAITLTATLDNPVQGGFTVDVSTVDGTATIANNDYTAVTGQTLTFLGTAGEQKTFTVTPTVDAVAEGDEILSVSMSNLANTVLDVNITDEATITINEDDDGTAPAGYTVTLDDALIGGAEVATSTFTFAGAEVGATYNYTISSSNGGTAVTGSGTIATATDKITMANLTGLNDGTLTLSVTLTDPANNVGIAATATTALDETAPAAPVVTSVSDDTGSSSSDGITSDNTPAVNGTAEANSTVEVFVGGSSVGTTTANGSGNWTLAYNGGTPLSDGTISVTAKATDAAGNTGSQSTAVNVTIDTTAPNAPVVSGITGDSGSSSVDGITNTQSNMVISGTAEANGKLEITFNGITFSGLPVDANGNWSLDISNTLSTDGTYTASISVTDAAGNTSTASSLDITFDTSAPAAPTVDLAATSDSGESDTDNLTNGVTPTIQGTAEANSSVEIFIDGNSLTSVTADANGNWTYTPTTAILEGAHSFTAEAADAAGNTSVVSSSLQVTVDTSVDSPILSPTDNATGILPGDRLTLTFDESVALGIGNIAIRKVSDNSEIGSFPVLSDRVQVEDNVVTITPINPLIYPGEELYVAIDAGAIIDIAGNQYAGINNNTAWSFTVIEAPVINSGSISGDQTFKIGDEILVNLTFSSAVTTTGSPTLPVTIGSEIKQFGLQGPTTNGESLQFFYTVVENDLDTDGISIGTSLNLNGGTIKDEFGTDAVLTVNVSFRTVDLLVDGVKPTPTITSNAGALTNAAFTATFTYDEAVTGLELSDISVTNGTASNFTTIAAGTAWSATITPTADGSTAVTLNADAANDIAGNASKAGNSVSTIFDGTAPTVTSITRAEADQIPTGTTNRNFTVVFSENVTGVDVSDFEVVTTGSAVASVNTVTAVDAKTYTVNLNGISGEGTIGLNAKDDNSIIDAATNPLASTFTGNVYTTNFAPTDITLSASGIQENNAVGDVIATIASTDADASDSHTYALVSGAGDTDNASFNISGNTLQAGTVYDFETKNSYSIRVRTSDGFGGSFEKALTISITNEGEAIIVVEGNGVFDQTVLGLSQTKNWTVTNNGDVATEVRIISSSQGFSINPGSLQVNPGEVKQITAVFRPREARVYTGLVVFNFDITDNIKDNVIEIGLSGEGVIVTGVDNGQINEEQISVFPNPASNYVTIDLSELNGMPVDIQMINPTGVSKLEKESYDKPELTIDVTNFESGLYIIQFSNERSLVRKKVLIRK